MSPVRNLTIGRQSSAVFALRAMSLVHVPAAPWARPFLLRAVLMLASLLAAAAAQAQTKPILTVEQECAALAFAPDGKLAYAVRRTITTRRLEMQRDDLWMVTPGAKPRRLLDGKEVGGERLALGYAIQAIRWSPDGRRLAVETRTIVMLDEQENTAEGYGTVLLEQSGKEIRLQDGEFVLSRAHHSAWLGDGVTVAFLTEAMEDKLLHSIGTVRATAERGDMPFHGLVFAAVAWDAPRNAAVALQRDANLRGPARLVWLDLLKQTRRELVVVENFTGGLSVSPSGKRVAYFRGRDTLEIRDVEQPHLVARVRVASGAFAWSSDETRVLLKRGELRKNGSLVWVPIPPLATESPAPGSPATAQAGAVQPLLEPILSGLTFRDFALSPDGRLLAVTTPGNKHLAVYSMP